MVQLVCGVPLGVGGAAVHEFVDAAPMFSRCLAMFLLVYFGVYMQAQLHIWNPSNLLACEINTYCALEMSYSRRVWSIPVSIESRVLFGRKCFHKHHPM